MRIFVTGLVRVVALAATLWSVSFTPAMSRGPGELLVLIDKSEQAMMVVVNGIMRYEWDISTGRPGHGTPSGNFRPQWMARSYFSKKYYNAPMPHAIFFYHGFAIHGTYDIHRLGGPASHGCVRLRPRNAATLFELVQHYGMRRTRIIIRKSIYLPRSLLSDEPAVKPAMAVMTERLMPEERRRYAPMHEAMPAAGWSGAPIAVP